MSLTSECCDRCLVWAVERPLGNRRRRSSTFFIGSSECILVFSLVGKNYRLFLHSLVGCNQYVHVIVNVQDRRGCVLPLNSSTVGWCKDKIIWDHEESTILKSIPDFFKDGHLVFIVSLGTGDVGRVPELEFPLAKSVPKYKVVVVEDKSVQTSGYTNPLPCLENLSEDLHRLMEEQGLPGSDEHKTPDVELVCGHHSVRAHSVIIASRSEVLAAMLQNDKVGGKVEIRDIDPAVFGHFMRYLYTGTLPDLTLDIARRLYQAADRYIVKGLMRRCSHFFLENLEPENACEILTLANAHGDLEFRESVMDYILRNKLPLLDDLWLSFCIRQPILALQVATRFSRSQDNPKQ